MIISPKNIKSEKIQRNRTINFDTVYRAKDNLVIIAGTEEQTAKVIKSKLFRPMQLMSYYLPRVIHPMNKKPFKYRIADEYKKVKEETNDRIKLGKLTISSYGERNLVYDFARDFYKTAEIAIRFKKTNILMQDYMTGYMDQMIENILDDVNYSKKYLVFPITSYHQSFLRYTIVPSEHIDPVILFLKRYRSGKLNKELYSKFDKIIFYNPEADAILALRDLMDPENDKKVLNTVQLVNRLNNFNGGKDNLVDNIKSDDGEELAVASEEESENELEEEEQIETTKDKISKLVLKKVSSEMKMDKVITDLEPDTREEEELAISITKHVNKYVDNKDNKHKNFKELSDVVAEDPEVKDKVLRYIETKKISKTKLDRFSKNLDKEAEVIDSIADINWEDSSLEPAELEVKDRRNVVDKRVDERMLKSTLANIDKNYNEKQSKKDLINTVTAFNQSSYLPIAIEKMDFEDSSDDFNEKETMRIKYTTDTGAKFSAILDIPKVIDDRFFYLGGSKKMIQKQITRLPIVKTKENRVEIVTNYNKMTIERTNGNMFRNNSRLEKILKSYSKNKAFNIKFGNNGIPNSGFVSDFEYEELASKVSLVESIKYKLIFNRSIIEEEISVLDIPDNFINDSRTPFGINKVFNGLVYLEDGKVYDLYTRDGKQHNLKVSDSLYEFITERVLGITPGSIKEPSIGKAFIYTKVKILGREYPMLPVIGIITGLTNILKRYKIGYNFSSKKMQTNRIEVKFKDGFFYYDDQARNTLLLNILYAMDTESYNFIDFDTEEPYKDYFVNRLDTPMYIKNALSTNLGVFIDPITKDILKELRLPMNIIDLMLMANSMLTSNTYRPQYDLRNYRIRGSEIIYAVMYKIMADAYVKYQNHSMNGKTGVFDLPRNALIKQLMEERNIKEQSTLNPVLEIEDMALASPKGFRGINEDSAYTLELRVYDKTMVGFTSGNATPYSGSAGITRSMVYNPKISTVRGYINDVKESELYAGNILSPTELLSPFTSTQADPPRQAMQVAQTKHTMPVVKTHKQLIGSGINKTLAMIISDDFAFKAKKDGIVELFDRENNLILLKYSDGTSDAIDMSTKVEKNSNSGFYISQKFITPYKEGEKFFKGDVLAYSPNYFSGKGKDVDFMPGVLAKTAIAPGDFAYEDSTLISETLSRNAAAKVSMRKAVALGPNATIHSIVKIGDTLKVNDSFIEFTSSFDDPDTAKFVADLKATHSDDMLDLLINDKVTTKYAGTIEDIRIYYNKPFNELSSSIKKMINEYNANINKRKAALRGIKTPSVHIPTITQQTNDRVGQDKYDGVLIEFYITYVDAMETGDKCTYSTALKGVISKVVSVDEAPLTEYRKEEPIEAILTPTGVISRMTNDIYSMLYGNKVLVELGKQIREIWEGKR